MPVTSAAVVAEARGWIGTPWRHQARMRGVGCDCLGLVVGVAQALGLPLRDHPGGYGRSPDGIGLAAEAAAQGTRLSGMEAGAIVLIRWDVAPAHVGILSWLDGRPGLIHAWGRVGCVTEHGIERWWSSHICRDDRGPLVYRLPGVEG